MPKKEGAHEAQEEEEGKQEARGPWGQREKLKIEKRRSRPRDQGALRRPCVPVARGARPTAVVLNPRAASAVRLAEGVSAYGDVNEVNRGDGSQA
jgi:hypothetical protein